MGNGVAQKAAAPDQQHQQQQQQQQQQQAQKPTAAALTAPPPPAAAAAAAEGSDQVGRGRAVGAPVTTPGVVKTKAGRRGAIGPLLKMLRAEAAAADQA
jgi:hypothetical protein